MCFSPEVSFGSAVALIPTGMWALWTAGRSAPRLWPLAVVPAVFGFQQACEGFVWLGQRYHDEELKVFAARAYLFFALAFWPFWFCAGTALIEPQRQRRRLLAAVAVLSTAWFWFVYLPVLRDQTTAGSCVCGHSIRYAHADAAGPGSLGHSGTRLAYILTAAVPVFVSSLRRVLFGLLALAVVSAGVAVAVYDHAFASVWCLFSAILSVSIVYTVSTVGNVPRAQTLAPA